jgi:hypothetical protein
VSSAIERERQRLERDRARAEAAFLDYIRAKEHYGSPKYSVANLWRYYMEFPDRAVTKHKPDLSRWRKDYDWDHRAFEYERKLREAELKDLEKIRKLRLDRIAAVVSDDAVTTLHELITDENVPPRVRYQACELALALIGVAPLKGDPLPADDTTDPPPPAPDASEEEMQRYYAQKK